MIQKRAVTLVRAPLLSLNVYRAIKLNGRIGCFVIHLAEFNLNRNVGERKLVAQLFVHRFEKFIVVVKGTAA